MDMKDRFEAAPAFPRYLETVRKNAELWRAVYERARVPGDVAAAAQLPGVWRLLALSEDWCGDACNVLPVVARLAETVPGAELRVLSRDDNPDLMDAHLTNGRSRSIPVVMLLGEDYREVAWWGPRPAALQKWMMDEGLKLESGPRYAKARTFYAKDKGRAVLAEVLAMMQAACSAAPCSPDDVAGA